MAQPRPKPASYDDLLTLPAHMVGEIVHGQLHAHPRTAPRHARAYSSLGGEIFGPFDKGAGGPGGWWILDEPEIHLEGHVLVPDMAGWRRERMPKLPDTSWFELAPDWVCEILSPSTMRLDRAEKLPLYAALQLRHAWLVDPLARTLEVFENRSGSWLLLAVLENDDDVRQPPFDAIRFPLNNLWAD